jgi:hypothetical protein
MFSSSHERRGTVAAGKSKSTGMFDAEALIEAQKRNFQALAEAGNIVAAGMRTYAERQVSIARDSIAELWGELQSDSKRKPAAPSDQLERMRTTFEKVVGQFHQLGQHMLDVQNHALSVLNECATKNLEALGKVSPELADLQQKAKQAFEHASQETSAVIDEMKRRVASLEDTAKSAAAAPAPEPAKADPQPAPAAAPAPKASAPKTPAPKTSAAKTTAAKTPAAKAPAAKAPATRRTTPATGAKKST